MDAPKKRFRAWQAVPAAAALAVALVVLLFWRSCCSFENRWQAAGTTRPAAAVELLEGRWEGTWTSLAREDAGRLRCVITKLADGKYHANFMATYAKVLSFNQPVDLTADKHPPVTASAPAGRWTFRGESDLGWLAGGVYKYEGHVTANEFYSTYTASADHGEFRMHRAKGATATAEAAESRPAASAK